MHFLPQRSSSLGSKAGERGQSLAEFGIVAVVFFLFVFGVFDMARLFQSWNTVQHAARESARYAITNKTSCEGASGRTECTEWVARQATTGLSGGGSSASPDVVRVEYTSLSAKSGYTQPSEAGPLGEQCDVVEITVRYTHEFATPVMQLLGSVGLKGTQRMMNEPWGPCPEGAAYAVGGGGQGAGGSGAGGGSGSGGSGGGGGSGNSGNGGDGGGGGNGGNGNGGGGSPPPEPPPWNTPSYHGTQGSQWTYGGVHYPHYYGWNSEDDVPLPPPEGCVYIGVPDDPDWNAHEIWCLQSENGRF